MAGIYIHIPFCRQSCHYCNFHFATSLRYKNEMLSALLKEIDGRADYLQNEPVETIYFGGGTPSLLELTEIRSLVSAIPGRFSVAPGVEITIETNPDDITEEKLVGWKQAGINRLSVGVQSFVEEDLRWMNRAHHAQQAFDSLRSAQQYFDNITADLIYGTPRLTEEQWKQNVDTMLSLEIPHLSCYALTVEPKTPLDKMIRQHHSEDIDPDKQSAQFLLLMQWLEEAGYEHYEISNFAKPGWRSRHNSSYWQGKKYLGIGPSAHSFDGGTRQWNISNNTIYIDSIQKGIIPAEKETLTPVQQWNEYIMTSLRTMEGTDVGRIVKNSGVLQEAILRKAAKFIQTGLMNFTDNHLVLTREGKLLADGIAAELFF